MEWAANVLVELCGKVLVRAAYEVSDKMRIRFRADRLEDPRCFFNKVPSQRKRWHDRGGALITWRNRNDEGPHAAILFVECPKSMEQIYRATLTTSTVGVIYEPPTWRPLEETLSKRHDGKPAKLNRQMERLRIVQAYVEALPEFSRQRLVRLLLAREEASRSSSAPESLAIEERSSGTPR